MSGNGDVKTRDVRTFFKSYSMQPSPEAGDWKGLDARPYYSVYDLGAGAASAGEMGTRLLRYVGSPSFVSNWQSHQADFYFLYVFSGSLTLEFDSGAVVALAEGDTVLIPGSARYRESGFSADCEIFEMTAPADLPTLTGKPPQGLRSRIVRDDLEDPIVSRETPEAYVTGNGPRKFFAYRDFGLDDATDGGIHIHLVRPIARPPGGTGFHYHSMGQFAMGLRGVAHLRMGNGEETQLLPRWGLSMQPGCPHDAWDFSMDYAVLEACLPAEYDTVATVVV